MIEQEAKTFRIQAFARTHDRAAIVVGSHIDTVGDKRLHHRNVALRGGT